MPTRSRTTFKKRQKEMARMEKQRDKAAKRVGRQKEGTPGAGPEIADPDTLDEFGLPLDLDDTEEKAEGSTEGSR
jgi:hypothetical protein